MLRSMLVFLIVLFSNSQANAVIIPVERIGTAYNDGWWYPSTSTYVGPGNRGGTAFGFSISQRHRVSIITGILRGVGDPWLQGQVQMSLHRGSRFGHDNVGPLPSNDIILTTERFYFPMDSDQSSVVHNAQIDLAPGEYWLAFQGGTESVGHIRAEGFRLESEDLSGVHAPEPATLLLMGGGLAVLMRRRKKCSPQ